ncbi:MAG TPA: hypothetical protein VLQ79_06180, partial [Myxococcaceae bacterium]|nr:hypothetical protein [Myxococcaceae bacterium]
MLRHALLIGWALVLFSPARAEDAWVGAARGNVRLGPGTEAPVIGELERGARVAVEPARPEDSGWTRLVPFGAVRTRLLVPTPPEEGDPLAGPVRYVRIRARSTELRAAPDPDARVVRVHSRGQILAVRSGSDERSAWLETPQREFLLRSTVRLLEPSTFHGVVGPPPRLAFLVRAVTPVGGAGASRGPLARGTALEVLAAGQRIVTPSGTLPRSAVRLAGARVRPAGIGPADR